MNCLLNFFSFLFILYTTKKLLGLNNYSNSHFDWYTKSSSYIAVFILFFLCRFFKRIKYVRETLNSEEEGAGGSMTESAMQNSIRLLRELDLITSSIQDASSLA